MKRHCDVKLNENPLMLIYAKTEPERPIALNKTYIQCRGTNVLSKLISTPQSCRLKLSLQFVQFRDKRYTHSTKHGCLIAVEDERELAHDWWASLES